MKPFFNSPIFQAINQNSVTTSRTTTSSISPHLCPYFNPPLDFKFGRSRGRTLDRANSFIGHRSRAQSTAVEKKAGVVIVDPFSTGAHLANEVISNGLHCVRVLSCWDSPVAALVQAGINPEFVATVQYNDRLEDEEKAIDDCLKELRDFPFDILAVIPGAETGVELADQLSSRLGLRTNGTEGSLARRNKYHMGEKVRNAGVRAVLQATCSSEDQLEAFLTKLFIDSGTKKSVVKPVQSAGSDDVFLCNSLEEAKDAFGRIYMKRNGLGQINVNVLVQEFLV